MRLKGKTYVLFICVTAGLAGFLFGFDTAVISGAINLLRVQFQLGPAMEGWVMSSALLGCIIGAAIAGFLSDRYGRKKILMLSAVFFIVSAIGCMLALVPFSLVCYRILGGLGVGFAAMVAPMFIAELAPSNLRGRLVSVYQLAITLGILCSYLSNAALFQYAAEHRLDNTGINFYLAAEVWRAMLGSNMIPALLFFTGLLFIPESPRWLLKVQRERQAFQILERINGAAGAEDEINAIKSMLRQGGGSGVNRLFSPKMRMALMIGIVLPFFSQLSGITTVMYYAPTLFEKAGFHAASAMGGASIIGLFNIIFTVVAIWKIDKWGRKPLMVWGFIGLSFALLFIGWLFSAGDRPSLIIVAFILYIAIFAATLGPGIWVVLSEIYPTEIRGRAMSLGTLSLFLGSAFVTQTYPLLRDTVGVPATFMCYALLIIPASFIVMKYVPETKGKSLEDIERYWDERRFDSRVAGKTRNGIEFTEQ